MTEDFTQAYKRLNKAQKDAVDSIDGPTMVVAGPGTGKTQVLALRIANILKNTDTGANSILCLTFTRSGVSAMKNRLEQYIGPDAHKVTINTFHSFAGSLVDKYYEVLGFSYPPKIMDDSEAVFLIDEILQGNDWDHIKTRTNPSQYFNDLKSLISLFKKEGITHISFLDLINEEINNLKENPESISSRGPSKGNLKKEILNKIESLERTIEVVKFYEIYEDIKKERGLMDYDDVLEYAVQIVKDSESARHDIQEDYLYVLIDEHQDSSLIQNNFLKTVWADTEMPNIFVVGDDRQLIYGFSGANLSYFEEFAHFFGKAKLITLVENYRSTENILNLADDLLSSSITKEKLKSNTKGNKNIDLYEYNFPRDEILHIGIKIKDLVEKGEDINDFAILVPKNKNVKEDCHILSDMDIPVVSEKNVSIFHLNETDTVIRVLKILVDPSDHVSIYNSLLDGASDVDTFSAHKFIKKISSQKGPTEKRKDFWSSVDQSQDLFSEKDAISNWAKTLKRYIEMQKDERISKIVSIVGNELLIEKSKNHDELLRNVEIVRSLIHLSTLYEDKNPKARLEDFIKYFERMEEYGTHINVATIGLNNGVRVMTLHKSKGLEYKYVFIAHMNEEILMSNKKHAFTLPEKIKELVSKKDTETAKRELYVAITRAKEYCGISYSKSDLSGRDLNLVKIIHELDKKYFDIKDSVDTEGEILEKGVDHFALKPSIDIKNPTLIDVKDFVKERYVDTNVTVSMLNNFFECAWKWYFRNFLKVPEVKSRSLAFGSAVHSTLEYILKEKKIPSDENIKNKIIFELEKEGIEKSEELKKLTRDGFIAIENWVKNFYKELSENYESERNISFRDKNFPNLNMYGKIDLTEKLPNGDLIITDFKTGSSKTVGVIEKLDEENRPSSYMRQLAMYSYLVRGSEGGQNVSEARLLFLEEDIKNKNYLYKNKIDESDVVLLVKDIKDYEDYILSGDWVKRPCYFKSFGGSQNECEYCKLSNKIFSE